ncbi:MAG: DUF177 domain-containing protein [Saprospiraceae bacterium]|jgi:uncharacterized metal-binding protein YceD (DUF177 family)|nr:DUF177 domain-containing protein [Saprospiraceae bacterium]HRD79383.1 DUF177 domain-containing protein [Saprospiraceae bacterium]HRF42022.1 DUF177 domain-containing protein [Saprospiraceae bacterium]HRK80433.1 DUF177 domain-containing protein [Saprospiraceae bacterium]
MDALIQYLIPVKGLRHGVYDYNFHIDREFFSCFEASPVADGDVRVHLRFDKQPSMFVLDLDIEGTVNTECDRCLAPIKLPIADQRSFVVKFSTEEESDDDDVVFIHPDTQKFDVSPYVYEYVVLAIPMVKTYDCENDPTVECNREAFDRYILRTDEEEWPEEPELEAPEDTENPVWNVLKQLNNDNNNN